MGSVDRTDKPRRFWRIFRRRRRPLELHRLAWRSSLGVKVLAMGIAEATAKTGRQGL